MDNYAILKIYDIDNAVWSSKMTKFMKIIMYFKQMPYINALSMVHYYIRSLFLNVGDKCIQTRCSIHSTWFIHRHRRIETSRI